MWRRIKAFWNGLPNPVKAALNTFWQTFAGVFGLALLGWVADIADWAGSTEGTFPSISPLGKAAVAAAAAAFSGLIALVVRSAQARTTGGGPQYPNVGDPTLPPPGELPVVNP